MSYYEKHIFVCENSREPGKRVSCGWSNTKEIRNYLKLKVKEHLPESKIRINMGGCLDRCEEGPVSVCYPEGLWLSIKSKEDADRFIENYLVNQTLEKIKDLLI